MIIGNLLILVYFIILLVSQSFPVIIISYVIFGIGLSCISGADESLFHDALEDSSKYQKIMGRYGAITIVSLALSSFLGGIIQGFFEDTFLF